MANQKLTALTAITTPASGDKLYIVDISDTTDSSAGSSRQITYTNFLSGALSDLGITSSVAELNFVDGVTSAIQTQINTKAPTASPTFTGTVTLPVGLTGVIRADSGVVAVDSDVTDIVSAASVTLAGKIEIATAAEVTTGTDTARAVTPEQFASGTVTLTNKRITKRTDTVASSATPTINTDTTDIFTITALAVAITSMTTNLSGTPTLGQTLIIRILDNGTARAITWGASFASRGATLPTTTTLSKYTYVGLIYNTTTSTWDCVASVTEA